MAFRFTASSLKSLFFLSVRLLDYKSRDLCSNEPMTYVDSHLHLADARLDKCRSQVVESAQKLGISTFIQGGIDPQDWEKQLLLQKQYEGFVCCFGLHPYFVAANSEDVCEAALDILSKMLPQAKALGELGLDFRPQICQGSEIRQIDFMEKQLELAQASQKPIVLHLVKAHEEGLRVLQLCASTPIRGMVHSFNGNLSKAEDFLNLGLSLSIGGPLCRPGNRSLQKAVKEIPLDKLLLETDSPDQPPPGRLSNEPSTLMQVAETLAQIKALPINEVLDRTSANARKLFLL
jgi:TatD DNase family protein